MKIDYEYEHALFLLEAANAIYASGDKSKLEEADKKHELGKEIAEKWKKKIDARAEWD